MKTRGDAWLCSYCGKMFRNARTCKEHEDSCERHYLIEVFDYGYGVYDIGDQLLSCDDVIKLRERTPPLKKDAPEKERMEDESIVYRILTTESEREAAFNKLTVFVLEHIDKNLHKTFLDQAQDYAEGLG